MQNDFRVRGRLENRTFALEFIAQNASVNQVPVVRDRHLPANAVDHQWLRVFDRARAGGRVAGVPDRAAPFESLELGLTKDLRHQAHVFVNQERGAGAVAGDDAGAFLAAMLEREKPVVGQNRRVGVAEHAEEAALVLRINLSRLGVVDWFWRDHTKTSTKSRFIQTRD